MKQAFIQCHFLESCSQSSMPETPFVKWRRINPASIFKPIKAVVLYCLLPLFPCSTFLSTVFKTLKCNYSITAQTKCIITKYVTMFSLLIGHMCLGHDQQRGLDQVCTINGHLWSSFETSLRLAPPKGLSLVVLVHTKVRLLFSHSIFAQMTCNKGKRNQS